MIITAVWYYVLDIVLFVATFFIIQKLYKRIPIINWEKTLRTITSKKVRKYIEIGYLLALIVFFIFCVGEIVIPSIRDLPLIVSGEYAEDTGMISRIIKDTVYIIDDDGQDIEIVVGKIRTKEFKEGDDVLVYYYPNMKRGFLYHIE